ncbi:hypothetical protein KCU90_g47, partial [Aureobasidium melanogenum]
MGTLSILVSFVDTPSSPPSHLSSISDVVLETDTVPLPSVMIEFPPSDNGFYTLVPCISLHARAATSRQKSLETSRAG